MKFFLLFIGFIFLLFAFSIASLVWKVRKQVRRMHDALRNNMNNDNYRRTTGNDHQHTTRTDDGITIIDNRDRNKKIFTQDEGEYVDYREE